MTVEAPMSAGFSGGDASIVVTLYPDEEAEFEATRATVGPVLVMRVGRALVRIRPEAPIFITRSDITVTCRLAAALSAYLGELERLYVDRILSQPGVEE
jgi:hypothetical protein